MSIKVKITREQDRPAPANARYRIEYLSGIGYVVLDPDSNFVQGSQTLFRGVAERMRDDLQRADDRKHKRGNRPCMCCGKTFHSAGIHNRMCDPCRRRDVAIGDEVRPSLPRAGGRRG